jgi:hypothetical protein
MYTRQGGALFAMGDTGMWSSGGGNLVTKEQTYQRRFPSALIRRARDLFTGYLDETTRNELIWECWVCNTDEVTVTLTSADAFYLRCERPMIFATLQATRSPERLVALFYLVCFGHGDTTVRITLPDKGHVDDVLEILERGGDAPSCC